jgi:hypothetical protein
LLDIVIANEYADKHVEKTEFVKTTYENKKRLQALQSIFLKLFSEASGYITDNDQLLAKFEETKTEATDIEIKLEKAASVTVVYLFALFHGDIQERIKYGKIGWNILLILTTLILHFQ